MFDQVYEQTVARLATVNIETLSRAAHRAMDETTAAVGRGDTTYAEIFARVALWLNHAAGECRP